MNSFVDSDGQLWEVWTVPEGFLGTFEFHGVDPTEPARSAGFRGFWLDELCYRSQCYRPPPLDPQNRYRLFSILHKRHELLTVPEHNLEAARNKGFRGFGRHALGNRPRP
jgi:hypothetical protein